MGKIALQYPLGSYSTSNPPSNQTLMGDLETVQAAVNAGDDAITALAESDALKATEADLTAHEADTSTHGVTEIVGKDETQTLTNKTLTSPSINTPIITSPTIKSWDGWNTVSDTWTYASATTITVPSGAASLYSKGDKIKLTQTTVKYFYVIGVADTTLTITGGTSYTLTNAAISAVSVSHIVNPIGFPQTFNYTPVITADSGSITSYTSSGKFSINGDKLTLYATYQATNVGTASGGARMTVPVTGQDDRAPLPGWEGASTGYLCTVNFIVGDLSKVNIHKYDFTSLWSASYVFFIAGTYSI